MNAFVLFAALMMLPLSLCAQHKPTDFEAELRRLLTSDAASVTSSPSAGELEIWKAEAREIDPTVSMPALMRLWIIGGQQDFILLEWWRKRGNDSMGRMLVVAFFECAITEPTTAKPNFASFADRFAAAEMRERKDEMAFVMANRSKLSRMLAEVVRKTEDKNRSEDVNLMLRLYDKVGAKP